MSNLWILPIMWVLGVGSVIFFVYAISLTGGALLEKAPELFSEEDQDDSIDVWLATVKILGWWRTLIWVAISILWLPILVVVLVFSFIVPDFWLFLDRLLTWMSLGFGSLPKKHDDKRDISTLT